MDFKRFPENDPFAVVDGIRYTIRSQGAGLVGTARVAARHMGAESPERIVTPCETEAAVVAQLDAYAAKLREEAEAAVPQAMAIIEAADAELLVLALMRIRIRDEAAWIAICTGMVDDRPMSRRRADWTQPAERQITADERHNLERIILNAIEAVRPEDPEEAAAWADVY